jgi:hypothetical protein
MEELFDLHFSLLNKMNPVITIFRCGYLGFYIEDIWSRPR